MEIIYVHGFGSEKPGRFEKSLARLFPEGGNDTLTVLRWSSGHLPDMTKSALYGIAAGVLLGNPRNLEEFLSGTTVAVTEEARKIWQEKEQAAQYVSAEIARLRKPGDTDADMFSLIGHSLGCQILVDALALRPAWLSSIHKVVLVGGAVGSDRLQNLPGSLLVQKRIVNFYSPQDLTLHLQYRAVSTTASVAAGLIAVPIPGIQNVHMTCQHYNYADHMPLILRYATCLPGETPDGKIFPAPKKK